MQKAVHVRGFQPEDFDATVALWRRSKRKAFPYVEVQQRYTAEEDRRHFEREIVPRAQIWVAEQEGRILGFLALEGALIDLLFVDVDAQGRGIGSALMAQAKEARPEGLRAYTFQKNAAARAFFEKHGFTAVGFGVSPPPEDEPDVAYAWRSGREG